MSSESNGTGNARRSGKSPSAFRTISEVSEDLEIPPHVLRFWETKFPQIKPLKRGGGRRYYRPEDVSLLKRIRELLYSDGYTIKGVQRLLKDGTLKTAPSSTNHTIEISSVAKLADDGNLSDLNRDELTNILEELIKLKIRLSTVS
jgi:DNA-binding transcriptional MerR regulator